MIYKELDREIIPDYVGEVERGPRPKMLKVKIIIDYADQTSEEVFEVNPVRQWLLDDLANLLRTLCQKSDDYASPEDDMENFRGGGLRGIYNRLGDKMQRLKNFIKNGNLHESFEDACLDTAGYALLLKRANDMGLSPEGDSWT